MKTEKPSIELYMYSLNQEFPVGKGHTSFIKRISEVKKDVSGKLVRIENVESQVFNENLSEANDWGGQWVTNEWIINWNKTAGAGMSVDIDPLLKVIIRQEDFGGIIFDPLSDRVFKVNKSGLKLFKEIQKYYTRNKIVVEKGSAKRFKKFESKRFKSNECSRFISFLEGANLWVK